MHFYERQADGSIAPKHFVPMTSRPGESRPTRVADARKHGWHPSVTTIQGLLDKPALTDWKITEHLKQAYQEQLSGHEQDSWWDNQDLYLAHIKGKTQAALDKAPKDGTDFHDLMEKWMGGEMVPDPFRDRCKAVEDCVKENTMWAGLIGRKWSTEQSFIHELGYAGKVDLHSVEENDRAWVIDYKTKNSADKWKPGKMHYPEMAMQLAAYRVGIGLDNARCANVFICLEDGAVEFHEWDAAELDKQFANFTDLLRIWLRNAGYVPGMPQ